MIKKINGMSPNAAKQLSQKAKLDKRIEMQKIMEKSMQIVRLEHIKNKIFPILLNKEIHKKELSEFPSMEVLDLGIIFAIKNENNIITITYEYLKKWDLSINELYKLALNSSIVPTITDMEEMITELMTKGMVTAQTKNIEDFIYVKDKQQLPLYIVLHDKKNFKGAGVILHEGFLPQLAAKFDSDVVILPCSIHELIVLPLSDDGPDLYSLNQMVREVNCEEVDAKDQLSDNIYVFRKKSQKIECLTVR